MRRIDLSCKLLGPLFIGLIDGKSTKLAIIVTFGMTLASVAIEYYAIASVSKCSYYDNSNANFIHLGLSFDSRFEESLSRR